MPIQPNFKDAFAEVFKDPSLVNFRSFIEQHTGEFNNCEFKEQWPERSDIARHILAIANSGGGVIIIGIRDEDARVEPVGLEPPLDSSVILDKVEPFLPYQLRSELSLRTLQYDTAEHQVLIGKTFQLLVIPDMPKFVPFLSEREGAGISRNIVYVRTNCSSDRASYHELQAIINRRISEGSDTSVELDLDQHLDQLEVLYKRTFPNYPGGFVPSGLVSFVNSLAQSTALKSYRPGGPNPHFPSESFGAFIGRMIRAKKVRIELSLDVMGLVPEPPVVAHDQEDDRSVS